MKKFFSRKLLVLLIGIASTVTGMATGVIPIDAGFETIKYLIMTYLGVQGAVDFAGVIKKGGDK